MTAPCDCIHANWIAGWLLWATCSILLIVRWFGADDD